MKQLVIAVALAGAVSSAAIAGTSVGVSIGINQPGMYGRIDIGNMPPPVVVYPQPVVVAPTPVAVYQQPIYVYVPPSHQENWSRYCSRYSACGQPVYFVHESWVREHDHRRFRDQGDWDGERGRREGHKHHED